MNILLVMPFLLTDAGGVSAAVRILCCEFAKGHHVSVLLPGDSNRVLGMSDSYGTPVFSVCMRGPHIKKAPLRALISFTLFLPFTLVELHRFLKRQQIDIVLIQYPLSWAVYFAILRWFSSWKLVVTYQGNDAHDIPLWTCFEQRCIGFLVVSSDCVVAVSKSLLNKLSLVLPVLQKKKKVVIPNGAPLDLLSQSSLPGVGTKLPSKYLLTVGHLVHRKGVDVLMRALRIAFDHGQVMNLVVIGDGPERETLSNLAAELGLSQNVHFLGGQPQEVVLGVLKECFFFVLASRAEGLPLVIAEAMACGKAVVSTNVDGVPEIVVEGRTGLLVEPENAQALAEALIELYQNSKLREMFGRDGKQRAEESFAWAKIATRYLELFKRLKTQEPLPNQVHF